MTTLQEQARQCAALVNQAHRVVALTGAGISTAAGIPDFRGPEGLYRQVGLDDPELIFDIVTFRRDPSLFYRFHGQFLRILEQVQPTLTHTFLAQEEQRGHVKGVVTQNIDALHQRAGSRRVLEIHGSVWDTFCTRCHAHYDYQLSITKTLREGIPHCDRCRGVLKPDVVFFGEAVKQLDACQNMVVEADLLLVLGTSLSVMPAAMLPALCPGKIVVVNQGEFSSSALPRSRVALFVEAELDPFFQEVAAHLEALRSRA